METFLSWFENNLAFIIFFIYTATWSTMTVLFYRPQPKDQGHDTTPDAET